VVVNGRREEDLGVGSDASLTDIDQRITGRAYLFAILWAPGLLCSPCSRTVAEQIAPFRRGMDAASATASAAIGGLARGYQAIFVPLAPSAVPVMTQWTVSQPYIYTSPRLR
jgi:hypothetical protein